MRNRLIAVCAFLAAIAAIPVPALDSAANSLFITEADIARLETGGFIWRPELAPSGPMMMVIDLHTQRAEVYRDGVRIGVSTVSTGKPGHRTPTGTYTVLEKQRFHRSSRYNNAPMPYMQRLTWYGIALHGGHLPGRPASHGCVRLPHAFAEALFWESTIGMKVIITDQAPGKENVTLSSTLNPRTGLQSCAAG